MSLIIINPIEYGMIRLHPRRSCWSWSARTVALHVHVGLQTAHSKYKDARLKLLPRKTWNACKNSQQTCLSNFHVVITTSNYRCTPRLKSKYFKYHSTGLRTFSYSMQISYMRFSFCLGPMLFGSQKLCSGENISRRLYVCSTVWKRCSTQSGGDTCLRSPKTAPYTQWTIKTWHFIFDYNFS